jgi:hypothetical protein
MDWARLFNDELAHVVEAIPEAYRTLLELIEFEYEP